METWVLIIWLALDRGGGPATAEFSTKERCEAAAREVMSRDKYLPTDWRRQALKFDGNYVCVPK